MKTEIREYAEEMPVEIKQREAVKGVELEGVGRWVISADNEGGYNGTDVDLLDVLDWVKKNKPELLNKVYCPRCGKEMEYKGKFSSTEMPEAIAREYHCDKCNLSIPTFDPDTSPFKKSTDAKTNKTTD